jgi:glutathione-regulated potassium-efflux system ancillary protein KefC
VAEIRSQATLWLGLALVATLVSIRLRIATALSGIVVATIAQLPIDATLCSTLLAGDSTCIKILAGAGGRRRSGSDS